MRSGKISKLTSNYSRKKLLYLSFVWIVLFVNVGITAILYFNNASELVLSLVIFFLLIIMMIVIFYCKSKISYFDMQQRYQILLARRKGLEKTNCRFDKDWILDFKRSNYSMYIDKPNYTIYYKITESIYKKTFVKTHIIEFVTIIKNNELDLFSDEVESFYKEIWLKSEKEYHLNKQVIIQFIKYDAFSESIMNNLNRIIAYKDKDNYLIHINCGYFPDKESIYYLHSDEYSPNAYYHYAVDLIKKIVK